MNKHKWINNNKVADSVEDTSETFRIAETISEKKW